MLNLPFLEKTSPPPFYQATLSDAKRQQLDKWFIGQRSQQYYMRQFAKMDKAGKLSPSWHWAAFFMTFGWLLYRKRFLDCLVYCVAGWSFIKVNIVIVLSLAEFFVIRHLAEGMKLPIRLTLAGVVWLFWASMVARWANAYYYRMARREIADALEFYPQDEAKQQAHLAHEGGVSLGGMATAFGIFGTLLGIIAVQFVPIIATQKEQALIYESYQTVYQAQQRVESIYQRQGCPVGLPLTSTSQKSTMQVVNHLAGVKTECAIVLTVTKAHYPVSYLNGQTLAMYRGADGRWRCQTSLNKANTPKRCIS